MYRQRLLEFFFLACRVTVAMGLVSVVLMAPPLIAANQRLTRLVSPLLPALDISQEITPATEHAAMMDALQVVWFGKSDSSLYSSAEVAHLLDVHYLFIWGSFSVGCAVALLILLEKHVIDERVARDTRRFIVFSSTVIMLCLLFFSFSFELFHQVFFPQGNYSFPEKSMIIQTFPTLFWALQLCWLQLGMSIVLWLQARYAERGTI